MNWVFSYKMFAHCNNFFIALCSSVNSRHDPLIQVTCKSLIFSDTHTIAVITLKILTNWPYNREMCPKDADGIKANSEDP